MSVNTQFIKDFDDFGDAVEWAEEQVTNNRNAPDEFIIVENCGIVKHKEVPAEFKPASYHMLRKFEN